MPGILVAPPFLGVVDLRATNTAGEWGRVMARLASLTTSNLALRLLPGPNGESFLLDGVAGSTTALPNNAVIFGTPATRIKCAMTGGGYGVTDGPFNATVGAATPFTMSAPNVAMATTFTSTTSIAVGSIVRLLSVNGLAGNSYKTTAVSGAGPFTITVDRPILGVYSGAQNVFASQPTGIRIYGNGMAMSGVCGRYVELISAFDCQVHGLRIDTVDGVMAASQYAISMDVGGHDNLIRDCFVNTTAGGASAGIALEGQEHSRILECRASSTKYGIYMTDCRESSVSDCFAYSCVNSGFGIDSTTFADSIDLILERCRSDGNSRSGYQIQGGATRVQVLGCQSSGNTSFGIELSAQGAAPVETLIDGYTASELVAGSDGITIPVGIKGTVITNSVIDSAGNAMIVASDDMTCTGLSGTVSGGAYGLWLVTGDHVVDGFDINLITSGGNAIQSAGAHNARINGGVIRCNSANVIGINVAVGTSTLALSQLRFLGANLATATGITTSGASSVHLGPNVDFTPCNTATSFAASTVLLPTTAGTDASASVAPVPANQTTPAANTGVLACVVTPKASGRFLVMGSIQFTGIAATAVTIKLRSQTKTAAIVVGNGTATGVNCYFATASGPITYGGGMTAADLDAITFTPLAGSLTVSEDFCVLVEPNATNGIAAGKNVAFEITVSSAGNVTSFTGNIGAIEV